MWKINFIVLWVGLVTSRGTSVSSYVKASTTLYNQTLITFGTQIKESSNNESDYKYYVWTYNLRHSYKSDGSPSTVSEVMFPDCIMADVFTFQNSTRYPNIMAFGQNAKEDLLDKKLVTSTFYTYVNDNWQPVPTLAANGPVRRVGASLIVFKNRIIVFGGFITAPNYHNRLLTRQLYSYDDETNRWTDLTQTAVAADIPPSAFHSASLIQDRYMVILGGSIALPTPDDVGIGLETVDNSLYFVKQNLQTAYIFDIVENKWTIKKTINFSSLPRIGHSADYIPQQDAIAVVGGTNKLKSGDFYDDLQLLDLNTWTWTQVPIKDRDGNISHIPRAWHASYLLEEQLFLMFKGKDEILDYRAINILNWSYTDNIDAAPLNSRIKPKTALVSQINNTKTQPNTRLILGATVGALGGGAISLVLVFLYLKFLNWYKRKLLIRQEIRDRIKYPFYLTPLWSNGTNQSSDITWDMNSTYANSTHLEITPASSHHYLQNQQTTNFRPRRWSTDSYQINNKLKSELTSYQKLRYTSWQASPFTSQVVTRYSSLSSSSTLDLTKV